jgi:hypothetical protein
MLRTLGANRRQILTTVMVEAVAIGLLGALLGIGGGFLIAKAINALFESFGIDLPTTNLVLESRTVIVSLLVGVLVTVASSLVPALRSTRVPPIAALHAFSPPPTKRRRLVYLVLSALLGALGLAMVLIGLFGSGGAGARAGLMGGGAVAVIFAVSLFSPRLVPPLAALAGWPLEKLRRLTGRLARENAQRNPSRTAVTAAALMIGVALVAVAALLVAASLFFCGGEHAVSEANVVAASRATAVRARVCTTPPSSRRARPAAMGWIVEGLGGGKATLRHRSGHEAVTDPQGGRCRSARTLYADAAQRDETRRSAGAVSMTHRRRTNSSTAPNCRGFHRRCRWTGRPR